MMLRGTRRGRGESGWTRALRGDRGTSALELALILPFFLMMLIGTVDFGMILVLSNMTSEAARDAARAAQVKVVQGDTTLDATELSQIQTAGRRVTGTLANVGTQLTITVSSPWQDANGYYFVTVRATSGYQPVAGRFVGRIIGTVPVSASSTLAVPCGKC